MSPEELRAEFVRLLTTDWGTPGQGDFNQAIFNPMATLSPRYAGQSIWDHTDLQMVMEKFDKAMANVTGKSA